MLLFPWRLDSCFKAQHQASSMIQAYVCVSSSHIVFRDGQVKSATNNFISHTVMIDFITDDILQILHTFVIEQNTRGYT